jgi:hypothetical protein
MSDKKTAARPPQVTVAGWVTIGASASLVLGMYESIGGLRSLDTRERLTTQLENPPWSSLGVDLQQWVSTMQVVFVIAGCTAAAAAILGGYVLRGDKAARIGLSVLAVPLFLTGLFSASIMSSLIAVSAVLLWTRPSRDWFAGRAPQPVERRAAPTGPPPGTQSGPPAGPPSGEGQTGQAGQVAWPPPQAVPSAEQPPPYVGFGAPQQPAPSPFGQAPSATQSAAPSAVPPAGPRPSPLVVACVITWTSTAMVAGFLVLGMLAFVADPTPVKEQMAAEPRFEELGMTFDQVRTIFLVMASMFVVWALSAALLALLVILRMSWARPLLVVSAVSCGVLMVTLAPFSMGLTLPVAVASGVTAYLLLRADVSRWLSRR